jgi:hypothetical protein
MDLVGRGAGLHPGLFATDSIPGQSGCGSIPQPDPIAVSHDNLDAHSYASPNSQPNSIGYAVAYVKSNRVSLTNPDTHADKHNNANGDPVPNQHAYPNFDTHRNSDGHRNSNTYRNPNGHSDPYAYSYHHPFTNGNAGLLRTGRFRRRSTEQLAAA